MYLAMFIFSQIRPNERCQYQRNIFMVKIFVLLITQIALPILLGIADYVWCFYLSHFFTMFNLCSSQACIPYLKLAKNPHILNISPPLNMKHLWFNGHVGRPSYFISSSSTYLAVESEDPSYTLCAVHMRL